MADVKGNVLCGNLEKIRYRIERLHEEPFTMKELDGDSNTMI